MLTVFFAKKQTKSSKLKEALRSVKSRRRTRIRTRRSRARGGGIRMQRERGGTTRLHTVASVLFYNGLLFHLTTNNNLGTTSSTQQQQLPPSRYTGNTSALLPAAALPLSLQVKTFRGVP
jgi:hypothetical protein